MKVKGKITKVAYEDVEVADKDIYYTILGRYVDSKKLDFDPISDYIDDGNLYKYTGDNYHNGNPEYDILREARDSDYIAFAFAKQLAEVLIK